MQNQSRPFHQEFMFAYRITIENFTENSLKLLRRHWHIFDSCGTYQEVEGDGVVGKQPVIAPGEQHTYISGCSLRTEIGRMHGTYFFERLNDGATVTASIPSFELLAPFKLS